VAAVVEQAAQYLSPKSRLATSLQAWFVGEFGASRFYVGKMGTVVLMLVISVLGFSAGVMLGVLSCWAVAIWALIDFIVAVTGNFRDSQGKIVKKW